MKKLGSILALLLIAVIATPTIAVEPKASKPARAAKGDAASKPTGGKQQEIIAEFDADGDGKLSAAEKTAARQAAKEKRKQKKTDEAKAAEQAAANPFGLNQNPGGATGSRGDGMQKLLQKFDMNRDGILSPQEQQRAQQYMQQMNGGAKLGLPQVQGPGPAVPPKR